MTIAAKHFDPLVGLDTHIILIPTPAGPVPTPLPHPYIGMLFDPMDWVPYVGATTFINGLPRGVAGSSGQALPPHIPMGGPFAKPPTNESEVFMGSATVVTDGDPQSFLGMPVLSCQDIGMPAPPRPKKKSVAKSMMLPTTTLLSIPMGPLVLVGGPPTVSMMTMAMKGAFAALKFLKKLGPVARKLKALSDKLHAAAEKLMKKLGLGDAARNAVHKAICSVTGHPVDIATGKVFTDKIDFELAGAIPLSWERTWFSTSAYAGPLGHGWHHSYDQALYIDPDVVLYQTADGRHIPFAPLGVGHQYYNRTERLTLTRDSVGYTVRDLGGVLHRFTRVAGRGVNHLPLVEILDSLGNSVRLHYDQLGRLVQIVDCVGRVVEITLDQSGRILALVTLHPDHPNQRIYVARYEYDSSGNLVSAHDALGQRTTFAYKQHLMVRETNRQGLSFYFTYDSADSTARCTRTWGDGGIYDHKLTYDLDAGATTVEDSLGRKTRYVHRGGLVISVEDPKGNLSKREFNEFNEQTLETDALGQLTTNTYDDLRGNLLETEYADGSKIAFEYDASDHLVEARDAGGGVWKYEYDAQLRLTAQVDPLGERTEYLNSATHVVGIREPAGAMTSMHYDAQGNLVLLQRDSWEMRWSYDAWGRTRTVHDSNGAVTSIDFNLLSRVVRVLDPDGEVHDYGYDAEGNLLLEGSNKGQTTYTYAGLSSVASRTEDGATVRFEYDSELQLIAVVNEHGAAYRYAYGSTGQVEQELGFDGLLRRFAHDPLDRVVRIEMPGNVTSSYEYDAMSSPTKVVYSDGVVETYGYTPLGQLRSAANPAMTVVYERDALGRIVKETQGTHCVESEYGADGERTRIRSSMGTDQEIRRNARGHAVAIAEQRGFVASFKRDVLGLELERRLPGGVESRWNLDQLGRPVQHEIKAQGTSKRAVHYEWDPNGRLRKVIDAFRGVSQFGHDARGRLSWAGLPDGSQVLRVPDAVGNLFRSQLRNDRVYGRSGELLESRGPHGTTRYSYDALGNMISKVQPDGRAWSYQWNAAGRLIEVTRPDGNAVVFVYDALGRRVRKTYRGQTTHWLWDGDVPLHEWVAGKLEPFPRDSEPASPRPEAIGSDKREAELEALLARGPPHRGSASAPITWVFEPDSLIPMARLCGEEQLSIVGDHLGTPVAAYDGTGHEVWSALVLPDGQLAEVEGGTFTIPFRFEGQYEDAETGLYYNRFRYFDADAGSYIGRDPIGIAGGTALYAYVGDPLTESDPFGLHKNQALAGQRHPVTGVPFNKSGYPVFDSVHDAKLPPSLRKATDKKQFKECNRQLADAIEKNPALKAKFTDKQLKQISAGKNPKGFIWHHHEKTGKMQLVDAKIHGKTGHAGGKDKWGGGKGCR